MPTPETTILDESAVNEIEAMDHADMCGNALYCDCGKVIRDQLCATVKHLRAENEDIKNQKWTAKRVIAWLDDPNPRPAIHAFTAGNERQIAYRVERIRDDLRSQLEQLRAELEERTDQREMWRTRYDEELKEHSETQSQLAQVEQERDEETERANRWEARAKQLGREVEKL